MEVRRPLRTRSDDANAVELVIGHSLQHAIVGCIPERSEPLDDTPCTTLRPLKYLVEHITRVSWSMGSAPSDWRSLIQALALFKLTFAYVCTSGVGLAVQLGLTYRGDFSTVTLPSLPARRFNLVTLSLSKESRSKYASRSSAITLKIAREHVYFRLAEEKSNRNAEKYTLHGLFVSFTMHQLAIVGRIAQSFNPWKILFVQRKTASLKASSSDNQGM